MGWSRSLGEAWGDRGAWESLVEPGELGEGAGVWEEAGELGEAWESLGNRFSLVFHWFSLVFLGFGVGRMGG